MGNLGTYQAMTTLAKKVGGPIVLAAMTGVAGYVVIRPAESGVRRAAHAIKKRNVPCASKGQVFRATSDGEDASGLRIREGDEYRVLECDGEAVLVEVIGDTDNPYFLSRTFLVSISDFAGVGDAEGQ